MTSSDKHFWSAMVLSLIFVAVAICFLFTASVAACDRPFDSAYGQINQDTTNYVVIPKRAGHVFPPDTIRVTGRPILRIDTAYVPVGYPYPARAYHDTVYVDTTRFYAQVDTVGWIHTLLTTWDTWPNGMRTPRDRSHMTPRVKTTWLPKVQVWLTPEEVEWDQCVRKYGGHESSGFYTLGAGPQKYTCDRCSWSVVK